MPLEQITGKKAIEGLLHSPQNFEEPISVPHSLQNAI